MDRRVKERLVGAAILVAVVVLVVPELLSGPPRRAAGPGGHDSPVAETRDPMRTVTVDLSQNSSAPVPAPPPEAALIPKIPASAAPTVPAATPAAKAAATPPASAPTAARPAISAPAVETPALEKPRPSPKSPVVTAPVKRAPEASAPVAAAHGAWAVQLGSFRERANALKLARHWKSKGYAAYLSSTGSGPRALHRVRIGPYADRGAALHAIAALASSGQHANLVAPGR